MNSRKHLINFLVDRYNLLSWMLALQNNLPTRCPHIGHARLWCVGLSASNLSASVSLVYGPPRVLLTGFTYICRNANPRLLSRMVPVHAPPFPRSKAASEESLQPSHSYIRTSATDDTWNLKGDVPPSLEHFFWDVFWMGKG